MKISTFIPLFLLLLFCGCVSTDKTSDSDVISCQKIKFFIKKIYNKETIGRADGIFIWGERFAQESSGEFSKIAEKVSHSISTVFAQPSCSGFLIEIYIADAGRAIRYDEGKKSATCRRNPEKIACVLIVFSPKPRELKEHVLLIPINDNDGTLAIERATLDGTSISEL